MFLWNGDEKNDRGSSKGSDWIRSVMGLDGILNQPNMLVGWISGQAARCAKIISVIRFRSNVPATKIVYLPIISNLSYKLFNNDGLTP